MGRSTWGGRLCQGIERTGVLPACLFFIGTWWLTPLADPIELDPDEGINLIKAMLHARGYTLYEEVWSDQPPLMTLLLAQVYEWAGPSLVAPRAMILGFATLLVWALYQILRLRVSVVAALAGVLLLVISRMYLRLSVSVMIGLPALALAMLAIYLLLRSRRAADKGTAAVLLVASGASLALALQAKLFAAVVVLPMVVVLMWPEAPGVTPWASRWGRRTMPLWRVGLWAATVAGVFATCMLLLTGAAGDQLLGTHVAAQGRSMGDHLHDLIRLAGMVGRHAIYLPLAAVALVWAWRRGATEVVLPAVWFVLAVVVLSVHRPLWYHHVLLLTIPLAWAAAYGVQAWLEWRTTPSRRIATAAVLAVGLAFPLATPLWKQVGRETYAYRLPLHTGLLAELHSTTVEGEPAWLFTDRPSYAYLADRLVPPALAVQTSKRWKAGELSQELVLDTIREYQPRDVVLERYNNDRYGDELQSYLARHYEPQRHAEQEGPLHFPPLRHHVRRESVEPAGPDGVSAGAPRQARRGSSLPDSGPRSR